jgi:hypothetical protein
MHPISRLTSLSASCVFAMLPCYVALAAGAERSESLSSDELAIPSPDAAVDSAAGRAVALEITWDDLLPPGEIERLEKLFNDFYADQLDPGQVAEGSAADLMTQIGTFGTVGELDESLVRIPGFIVPLNFTFPAPGEPNRLGEFLLVPYFGACIHSPPPPPNQILYVTSDPPISLDRLWDPITVQGVLRTGRRETELANAAYTLALEKFEPYEF